MSKIIGHKDLLNEFNNIINAGTISHSYLFSGIDGIGKFEVAKEFAKGILCTSHENGKMYCGECEACRTFETSDNLIVVEPEEEQIKVDAIRTLIKSIMLKPTNSAKRVFIIRDAELMNESAQNALLKILEEPPSYATIILTSSNKSKLLNTILSRCTTFEFLGLSKDELKELSKINNIDVNDTAIDYSLGSFGRLIKLTNSNLIETVSILEEAVGKKDLISINDSISKLKQVKTIKEDINEVLNLLIVKLSKDLLEDTEKKIKVIELIEEIRDNLTRNANFDTSLDYLMIKLWKAYNT